MIFWLIGCRLFGHVWDYGNQRCVRCWTTAEAILSGGSYHSKQEVRMARVSTRNGKIGTGRVQGNLNGNAPAFQHSSTDKAGTGSKSKSGRINRASK